MGLDPSQYRYVTNEEAAYEDTTRLSTVGTGLKQAIGPTAGALGGAKLGMMGGAVLGPIGAGVGGDFEKSKIRYSSSSNLSLRLLR